jgi:hypothetical protein
MESGRVKSPVMPVLERFDRTVSPTMPVLEPMMVEQVLKECEMEGIEMEGVESKEESKEERNSRKVGEEGEKKGKGKDRWNGRTESEERGLRSWVRHQKRLAETRLEIQHSLPNVIRTRVFKDHPDVTISLNAHFAIMGHFLNNKCPKTKSDVAKNTSQAVGILKEKEKDNPRWKKRISHKTIVKILDVVAKHIG